MTSQIHFFCKGVKFSVKDKRGIIKWIEGVVRDEKKILGDINFILTNDKSLLEFNIKFLNTDTYTDIITFLLSEEPEVISGDVYISVERVQENAKKFYVSQDEELRRVLVHGILHLVGYNDVSASDKRRMTSLENRFLKNYF